MEFVLNETRSYLSHTTHALNRSGCTFCSSWSRPSTRFVILEGDRTHRNMRQRSRTGQCDLLEEKGSLSHRVIKRSGGGIHEL